MWLKGKVIAEERIGRTQGGVLPSFYQLEKETGEGVSQKIPYGTWWN